jgi:hypothetical protein
MDYKTMFTYIVAILAGVTILISPVQCTMNRQELIAKAIKEGADPIAAKCAIESDTGSPICLVKASQK